MAIKNNPAEDKKSTSQSRWSTVALVLIAAFVLIKFLMPSTIGETARRQFLSKLQQHYKGLNVSVGRGTFLPSVGFVFENISVAQSSRGYFGRGRNLVSIGKITAVGDFQTDRLLDGNNPIVAKRLKIEDVELYAWMKADEHWSIEPLFPPPQFGPCTPRIEIERLKLHVHGTEQTRAIECVSEHITVNNRVRGDGGIDRSITASGVTDFADSWILQADLNSTGTDVRIAAKRIHIEPSFWSRLPAAYQTLAADAMGVQCTADASLSLFRPTDGPLNYVVKSTIHDGRVTHHDLPVPLENVRGRVELTPDRLLVEASQATIGSGTIKLSGNVASPFQSPACDVRIAARGLNLDSSLAEKFPEKLRVAYDKLRPVGGIDADLHVKAAKVTQPMAGGGQMISGSLRQPELPSWYTSIDGALNCKGIDVEYEHFPYPITQLVGMISIADGRLVARDLGGRLGDHRIRCELDLPLFPNPQAPKRVALSVDGPVTIDDRLVHALTPRGKQTSGLETFVRTLSPRGSVQLTQAIFETDDFGNKHKSLDIAVTDGNLRYDAFPYPLYNVTGTIQVRDELVELHQFRGTNAGAAVITCAGTHRLPRPMQADLTRLTDQPLQFDASTSELDLQFCVNDLAMDRAVRDSLRPESQRTWDAISPNGMLDHLQVDIHRLGKEPLEMNVTAFQNERQTVTNNLLSVRPVSLPYRLDIIGGRLQFDGHRVLIENIRGVHETSRLSAAGACQLNEDNRWVLALEILSGSRLDPDAELIASLPESMRKAMRQLQLRGPVNVRGNSRLVLPDSGNPEPVINWDLVLQLEGNRIGDQGPVHSMRGEIKIDGQRDQNHLIAAGRVVIDSMHVYDQQITSIRGPFLIQDDEMKLGTRAGADSSMQGTSIIGNLFGGDIRLDGDVKLSSGDFDVAMAIRDAQVPMLMADFGHGDQDITGQLSGSSNVQGNLGSIDLLRGGGSAKVSGSNLYELPLLIQFFNQFRITPSPDNAFTDAEVEFKLFGDLVNLDSLKIWGDIISLHGGGTMDRRRELDLTFNTQISPRNTFTQLLRPLRPQEYAFSTVDVRGPLDDLRIEKRALEGVGQTLEKWFPIQPAQGRRSEGTESSVEQAGFLGSLKN
jgi:hypothetical protein